MDWRERCGNKLVAAQEALKAVRNGDTVQVKVEADTDPRVVDVPGYLKKFLQKNRVWDAFNRTSYTHQKEHVSAVNEAK